MKLSNWLLPPEIKRHLDLVLRSFLKKEISFSENAVFKNICKENKRCFILGCGPSINQINLEPLKNELCISVSNFFVHKDFSLVSPKFHVFAPSHPPITESQFTNWLFEFSKYISDKQTVFYSHSDSRFIKKSNILDKINNYCYSVSKKEVDINNEIEFTKQIPNIMTVVHIAIYLAIYIGVKEIYLLGVDHDWLQSYGKSSHFYKENESKLAESGYDEYSYTDLETEFYSHYHLWKIYKEIKKYSIKHGIQIFNANPDSFLDVFPRKAYNSLF